MIQPMKKLVLVPLTLLISIPSLAGNLGAFDPFAFQEVGSCADTTHLSFNYLKPEMLKSVGKDGQGRDILYGAQVSIGQNGTFRIASEEYVMQDDQKTVLKSEKINGKAKLSTLAAKQLDFTDSNGKEFGGLVLTDMQIDPFGQMIMLFVIDRNDIDGQPLAIGVFYEKGQALGPSMESPPDYCKNPL